MENLILPVGIKFNSPLFDIRLEDEMSRDERNAVFSLGIDVLAGHKRDSEFGLLVGYKVRVRDIIH